MKYRWKKVSVIFLLSCLILNGCSLGRGKGNQDQSHNSQVKSEDDEVYAISPRGDKGNDSEEDSDDAQGGTTMRSVKIYTVENDIAMEKNVGIPADIEVTPEYVVQMVIAELKDQSYVIKVNEVKEEGQSIVVDFDASAPPVLDVGEATENAILDAIAMSILADIDTCTGVIYRVNGQPYVNSNHSFDYNYVYLNR